MFEDRRDAGRSLAAALEHVRGEDPIVLGLPRGGVVVAAEVAAALGAPLDLLVAAKVRCPMQPELAAGAVGPTGEPWWNEEVSRELTEPERRQALEEARREATRRVRLYRGDRPEPDLRGRTVLLVDDGIATGSTVRAAVREARRRGARRVVVAVPGGAPQSLEELEDEADEVVAVERPRGFRAVGELYRRFDQVTDGEVLAILRGDETPRGPIP